MGSERVSAARFTPVQLEFDELTCRVPLGPFSSERKEILKGVSGKFKSGELTAIMGPSGAGKSTLLNVLTGFQTTGVSGKVYANGRLIKPGEKRTRRESAYIMQDDHLNPLFTLQEIMVHSANLKIGNCLSRKAKLFLIKELLESLSLGECVKTVCGRLSGGQRKRVSIALELVSNPAVLFLDEPTSGLDSLSSLQLVRLLENISRQGRTVVCTIHQPSATLFEMFHHVYVIAEGHCLYQGSSGNVVPFLRSVDLPCPKYHNPADFMMDVICGEFGYYSDRLRLASDRGWRDDQHPAHLQLLYGEKIENNKEKQLKEEVDVIPSPSEWHKYKSLIPKIFLQFHRDWAVTYLKLLLHTAVAIIIGLMFYRLGNDATKVISNLGFMFITLCYISFTSLMPAALKFPSEIKIIKKEHFNNWYQFKTYFLAFMTVNIPVQMLFSFTFVLITYVMTSQSAELYRFLLFLCTVFLTTITAEFIGVAMGTAINPVNGVFNGSVLLALFVLLGGFLVFLRHMPPALHVFSFVSYLRYAFELMVAATYGQGRADLACHEDALYCHFKDPALVFTEIGLTDQSILSDFTIFTVYTGICALSSYFLLKKRLKMNE